MTNTSCATVFATCLALLFSCDSPKSKDKESDTSCVQKENASGNTAFVELQAMARSVSIGTACRLVPTDNPHVYMFKQADGSDLEIDFASNDSSDPQGLRTSRALCSGVPYWFTESNTVIENSPAMFYWNIREDQNKTVQFFVQSKDQGTSVSLAACTK